MPSYPPMAESIVARKPTGKCRSKVRTGCATCRIRRVKCDENKPFCRKCVGTGRTCDGYESPFRLVLAKQSIDNAHAGVKLDAANSQPIRPSAEIKVSPQDIDLLGRYFSTKTMLGVQLGCYDEAKNILQASLTDPAIRHAVSSLRALRENLETSGDAAVWPVAQQIPTYGQEYGLQQYCMALGGLAASLSSLGSNGLSSALLCCHIFISIEQVRGNYSAMTQHMIRGLNIMHEYRARPNLSRTKKLVPALHKQIPLLDVFIIKLFAAPCKFADPPVVHDESGSTVTMCPMSPHQQSDACRNFRPITPDIRAGLTKIAGLTLEFLRKVAQVELAARALQLVSEKMALLDSLESWLISLELVRAEIRSAHTEPLSVSFLRFFHRILKLILLGTLNSSSDLGAELKTEIDQLHRIAGSIEEGVKTYRIHI